MNLKFTSVLLSASVLSGCASLQPPEQNSAQLAALPAAANCDARLPFFGYYLYSGSERGGEQYAFPDGRIAMGNDGGWCVITYQVTMPNGSLTISPAEVAKLPANGAAIVGTVNGKLRIAYRPQPGFTGEDSFQVYLKGPIPYEVPIRVSVRS